MEDFLAEYSLSTDEGVALMCLSEALLRVPDAPTIDALIHLSSQLMDIPYAEEGLTLEKMGLAGLGAAELDRFVEEGL